MRKKIVRRCIKFSSEPFLKHFFGDTGKLFDITAFQLFNQISAFIIYGQNCVVSVLFDVLKNRRTGNIVRRVIPEAYFLGYIIIHLRKNRDRSAEIEPLTVINTQINKR